MDTISRAERKAEGDNTLAGGGDMGTRMRAYDWDASPLGPVEAWPQSLRTAVSICLASRFPIILFWGQDLRQFYNDAYRPILGMSKHPQALGQRAQECWPEIWDVIGPMLYNVLSTGEATWSENQLLLLDRNSYVEECYFTFSYSPIRDETGEVSGVFCAVTETTQEVINARRLRTLRMLVANIAEANSSEMVCQKAAQTLAENVDDIPFALLYLLSPDGTTATFAGAAHTPVRTVASPEHIVLSDPKNVWPFMQVIATEQAVLVESATYAPSIGASALEATFSFPDTSLVLPLSRAGEERPYGFLVAGISPHRLLDEEYQGFLMLTAGHIATAITTVRAYREERERAEALAELNRAKIDFFSNISHEFRTPLTLAIGPLEAVLSDSTHPLSAGQRDALEMVRRNELRQLKLVNTLLDFSRLEAGRLQAVYEPVDLATFTRDLVSAFQSVVEHAGMQLLIDCPPLGEPMYVDRQLWEKIVFNLLSNAFKFTFEGYIRVALSLHESNVQLVVQDTGVGVAEADLPHLFERFYQVRGTRARAYEGSGIGLSLAQELVQLHAGTITAQSTPGVGTTFTIQLPRGTAHLPADHVHTTRPLTMTAIGSQPYVQEAEQWLLEPSASTDAMSTKEDEQFLALKDESFPPLLVSEQQTRQGRILIVDDNADMRNYLQRLLAPLYTLRIVVDGTTALELVQHWTPDLILTDVMMPGLDGFGLLAAIRAKKSTQAIPVMLLSARAGEEAILDGLKAGADDYLVKPFSARELLIRIEARLEITRLRRQVAERANQLETIFETLTDGLFVYDQHGQIIQMNQAVRVLLGIEQYPDYDHLSVAERIALFDVYDETGRVLPTEEWPVQHLLRGERLDGGTSPTVVIRTIDGRQVITSVSGAPMRNVDGSIMGAVLLFHDVTTRRRLEKRTHKALHALLSIAELMVAGQTPSANDAEKLAEQSDVAVATIMRQVANLACQVLDSTGAAMALFAPQTEIVDHFVPSGFTRDTEQSMRTRLQGIHLADYIEDPAIVAGLRRGEVVVFDVSLPPYPKRPLRPGLRLILLIPMRLRSELVGVMVLYPAQNTHVYTDAEKELAATMGKLAALVIERERLLAERTVAQANTLVLQEANRRMDEFLAMAGHEIRTPLTTIKANIQLAQRILKRMAAHSTEDTKDASMVTQLLSLLSRAAQQVERQNRLVQDLLDVSRIRVEHLEIRQEHHNLIAIVRQTVADQFLLTPTRTIQLAILTAEEVPVLVDRDRVEQVLNNYLSNALKYSDDHMHVVVRVEQAEMTARVSVIDQGPGLSEGEMQHIWERFHRVPGIEVKSGTGVGLGLGLHISQTLIERQGGHVGVESVKGEGSTFWFTLPIVSTE